MAFLYADINHHVISMKQRRTMPIVSRGSMKGF